MSENIHKIYDKKFYNENYGWERRFDSAAIVIAEVFKNLKPTSVIDFGCGLAHFLKTFKDAGVEEVFGIDGNYVDKKQLKISVNEFIARDLSLKINLDRLYDLVMSVEVAEHLDSDKAQIFVDTLCTHGNTIMFSAAIPKQGGVHHVNEQYPSYWAKLFLKNGFYALDILRPAIWENSKVEAHFRQNLVFYINEKSPLFSKFNGTLYLHNRGGVVPPLDIVHPEYFKYPSVRHSFKELLEALRRYIKKHLPLSRGK